MAVSRICQEISAIKLAAQAKDVLVLDVRSQLEFECAQIAGSVNFPYDEIDLRLNEIPLNKEIVLVSRSGQRAERASYLLMGHGLESEVLRGGILAWVKAGFPVIEGRQMLSIERQTQLIIGLGLLLGAFLTAFVSPYFLVVSALFGAGLTYAALTGTCGLAILLAKANWNRPQLMQSKSKSKDLCLR